jgi:hypothetical protein
MNLGRLRTRRERKLERLRRLSVRAADQRRDPWRGVEQARMGVVNQSQVKLPIATDGTPRRAATSKASGGISPTISRTSSPANAAISASTRRAKSA